MLDHHLQPLRSMPVNLSLNSNTTSEHHRSKYGAMCLAGDSRGGVGKGGGGTPLVKIESQMYTGLSCSGGAYREDLREQTRVVYEQSHYDLPLAGFLKSKQRSIPDSTNEDAAGEVGFISGFVT